MLYFGFLPWVPSQTAHPEHTQPVLTYSREGGYYAAPLTIELYAPGAEIYYTTNGNQPSRRAIRYTGPISIDQTTVLRAVAYRQGNRSDFTAQTYFIGEPATRMPIVSIGISPYILFDPDQGLFTQGSRADTARESLPGANFWSRQEVTANIEIYESDGRQVYNSLSGFRLFGGMSRLFPQKSIAIVARGNYGQKRIRHEIFGKAGKKKFKFLILRNSGSDWGRSHLRDALITSIVKDWNLDLQDYRPAHVYINGHYWGIYNIREKINRYFLASHHDVDKDSLDILEHYMTLKKGSRRHYQRLLAYLQEYDLADPLHYAHVRQQMDIENYIDHQIAQIYFDNRDAGGNIRFWRPQTSDGRWRWILYDTDWGMGLHYSDAAEHNSLAFHTEANGPGWPNPPWSTFLLRKLLDNDAFRAAFINRFADRLNTDLRAEHVLLTLERMYQHLRPEMPRHLDRWRIPEYRWTNDLDRMREFARKRPIHMWQHLQEFFQTGPRHSITLSATAGGHILVNRNLSVGQETYHGYYFRGIPISLQATPNYGYRFVGWEGLDYDATSDDLYLRLPEEGLQVRAVFEPYQHPMAGKIMINEIAPNNKQTEDWLEIYNHTDKRVALGGYILKDQKNNEFIFPEQTYVGPKDYLVVCEDMEAFRRVFPRAYNVVGNTGFGLNKHEERLELFSHDGAMIDSVAYRLPPTDSLFSLDLLLPRLDNSDPENWRRLYGVGSPNAPNPYFVESNIQRRQTLWMQIGLATAVALLCILLLVFKPYWRS